MEINVHKNCFMMSGGGLLVFYICYCLEIVNVFSAVGQMEQFVLVVAFICSRIAEITVDIFFFIDFHYITDELPFGGVYGVSRLGVAPYVFINLLRICLPPSISPVDDPSMSFIIILFIQSISYRKDRMVIFDGIDHLVFIIHLHAVGRIADILQVSICIVMANECSRRRVERITATGNIKNSCCISFCPTASKKLIDG